MNHIAALTNILPTVIALVWAGMVIGISFLESWVKFKTPGLEKPQGLAIGRTVFRAFNYAQALLLVCLLSLNFYHPLKSVLQLLLSLNALILFIQIFWLFPKLSRRVDQVIAGESLPKSAVHAIYGLLEILKLVCLLSLGIIGMAN